MINGKKQVYDKTAREYADWLTKGIDFEQTRSYKNRFDKNNAKKTWRGYKMIRACLGYVDAKAPTSTFKVEGVWGKACRPFDMPNLGSLGEVIVNCIYDKEPAEHYSKEFSDDGVDMKVGFMGYEIKTCAGDVSHNTRANGDRPVLLINQCGVFSIKIDDIPLYIDKYGRFPCDEPVGTRWEWLSEKLGLTGTIEEDEEA